LGGNRRGKSRQYLNLLLTMLLGGLWHGAAWTFVAWGALHGLALAAHRAFRSTRAAAWLDGSGAPGRVASTLLTFLFVVVAWVFFRAESLHAAGAMLGAMTGTTSGAGALGLGRRQRLLLAALVVAAWTLSHTQQITARYQPALPLYRPIDPPRAAILSWAP